MSIKPNFLVIGDHKTGTTSINEYLKQHPDVYVPRAMKELRYFAFDAENDYHCRSNAYRVRTLKGYLGYFSDATTQSAIGETSPNYLRAPGACLRIKQVLPDAKLILSLRNPAERLFSMYQMELRAKGGKPDFDAFVFANDARCIKGNFYWPDLKNYYDIFPRENILVVLMEDLTQDQAATMGKIYQFIGVDANFKPSEYHYNTGGVPNNRAWYLVLMKMRSLTKALGFKSAGLKDLGKGLLRRSLSQEIIQLSATTKRKILAVCQNDVVRTQELIGRDLSHWLQ